MFSISASDFSVFPLSLLAPFRWCVHHVWNHVTSLFGCWRLPIWRIKFDSTIHPWGRKHHAGSKGPDDFRFRSLVRLKLWRFKTFWGYNNDAWMEMKENPWAYLLNLSLLGWYLSVCTIGFRPDDGVYEMKDSVSQSHHDRSDHLYNCQIWIPPSELLNVVLEIERRVY